MGLLVLVEQPGLDVSIALISSAMRAQVAGRSFKRQRVITEHADADVALAADALSADACAVVMVAH